MSARLNSVVLVAKETYGNGAAASSLQRILRL